MGNLNSESSSCGGERVRTLTILSILVLEKRVHFLREKLILAKNRLVKSWEGPFGRKPLARP